MEQIELVIRLQKKLYDEILSPRRMDEEDASACYDAIKNGIPLPKGHGKIVDLNDVIEAGAPLYNGDREIGFSVDYVAINDIPVLVEADKEGEE